MSEKKELNGEQLEKVSGGVPYLGTSEPTVNNFYFHVGDTVNYGQFLDDGSWFDGKEYTVVALGKKFTGSNGYVKGYDLLYKLEIKDRTYSHLDGWYDLHLDISPKSGSVIGKRIVKVLDVSGIEIVN